MGRETKVVPTCDYCYYPGPSPDNEEELGP